jgi:hypothetical protein
MKTGMFHNYCHSLFGNIHGTRPDDRTLLSLCFGMDSYSRSPFTLENTRNCIGNWIGTGFGHSHSWYSRNVARMTIPSSWSRSPCPWF